MSDETEYTVHRHDSRDSMVLDAADPAASLEVLLKNAQAARDDAQAAVAAAKGRYDAAIRRRDQVVKRVVRFADALDAVRAVARMEHS